jgi:hypothetical protein
MKEREAAMPPFLLRSDRDIATAAPAEMVELPPSSAQKVPENMVN